MRAVADSYHFSFMKTLFRLLQLAGAATGVVRAQPGPTGRAGQPARPATIASSCARGLRRSIGFVGTWLAVLAAPAAFATPTISFTGTVLNGTSHASSTPTGLELRVNASPTAGSSIVSVQFFANGTLIGVGVPPAAPPGTHAVTWFPAAAGVYTVTATITDTSAVTTGASASTNTATVNSIVTITSARNVTVAASSGNLTPAENSQIFLRSSAVMSDKIVQKVEFFVDGGLVPIATATQAPFNAEVVLTGPLGAGSHTIVAVATNTDLSVVDSAPLSLNVGVPVPGAVPTVTLNAPAQANVNQNVSLSATASDTNGFIPSTPGGGVTFLVDGDPVAPVGTGETNPKLTSPYSITWRPTVTKTYSVRAQTVDDSNNIVLSAPVLVNVVATIPTPSVSLTSPTPGSSVGLGMTIPLNATATPGPGTTVQKVDFYLGGSTLIGTSTSLPYTVNWVPSATGAASLTARVTDSNGTVVTSNAVNVTVTSTPTIAIATPTNGTVVPLGTTTTLTATASGTGGATVSKVDFLIGSAVIGTALLPLPLPAPPNSYAISWTPPAAGIIALTARVTDSNGATATSTVVNVNVTGPTVAVTNPVAGSTVATGVPVTLSANALAVAPATVSQVDFYAGTTFVGSSTFPYSVTWTPTTTGAVAITARVNDSNGAVVTSTAVNVTVAASAPTISLTSPLNGTSFALGSPVPVTINANATGGGIAAVNRVDFLVGNTVVGTDLTLPYSFDWIPTAAGIFALTARVTDSNGATATSSIVNVNITGPTVAVTGPTAGTSVTVGVATNLSATASAVAPATVTQVDFFAGVTHVGTSTSFPFQVSWTPTATGTVAITARVTDSNGAVVTSGPVNVTAVISAPTIAITSPTNGTTLALGAPVTLSATAAGGGIATVNRVDFLVGNTIVGTDLTFPYTFDWTPTTAGISTITARVTDSNGTTATSPAVNVTVVGSTVTLTSPAPGSSVPTGTPVTLSANATPAAGASVTQVDFLAGNVVVGTATTVPYTISWVPSSAGNIAIAARVTDSNGVTATSSAVTLTVTSSLNVNFVTPAPGQIVTVGIPVNVLATATTGSGTVTQVQFSLGNTILDTLTAPPYSTIWTPGSAGNQTLTARMTTSTGETASTTVSVTAVAATPSGVTLSLSPTATTLAVGSKRYLTATVASSIIVDEVQFYYDGSLIGTTRGAPYNLLFNVPEGTGSHYLEAYVVDVDGRTYQSPRVNLSIIGANGAPPNVGILTPIAGALIPAGTSTPITLSASDPDGTISTVQVYANGALIGTASGSAPNYSLNWTPSATGSYQLTAVAVDNQFNAVSAPGVAVQVTDGTSPSIGISLTPGSGAAATTMPTGATRNVLVTATPSAGRAVVRVEFFVNGGKVGEDTVAPYSFRYTAPDTPGTQVLSFRATDNAGNGRDASVSVNVISAVGAPPSSTLITPANNSSVVPNTALSLAATATATGGSISSLQFYQNGSPVGNPIGNPPYTSSFTPTSPGTYVFDAIATDDRGNTAVSNAVNVTAAFGIPTIAITSPRTDSANSAVRVTPAVPITISASATGGTGATILLVEFLVDGLQIGARTTPSSGNSTSGVYSFAWTPDLNMLGAHVLTARVTDTNSNTATSTPININVASIVGTPPTISVTGPSNNATIQSLSTVNFTANTSASATSVEFFLNETSVGLAAREQQTNTYRLAYNFGNFNFSALTPIIDPNTGNPRYTLPFYAIAKDSNGNQTVTPTFNLNIVPSGSLPPSVQLVTIGIGGGASSVTAGTPFAVGAVVADPDGTVTNLQLFSNGGTTPVTSAGNPAPNTILQYTPNTAGRFNLYAVVTDDSGNTTVSTPIVLNVTGNTAPTAVLVRPSIETTSTTVSTPVFLEATAADPDIGQNVTVTFINTNTGQTLATGTRVGTTDTYRAIWTPTQANTFTVGARALDSAGGSTTSSITRRVVVSNVQGIAPTVTINVPGSVTTASTSNFTATANDSDGSVIGVEFFLNRNSIGDAVRDQLTNTWRLAVSFAGVPPGSAEVVALVRDSAGNVAASPTSNISVSAASSIAPSVTITPSTTNAAFSRQLQLTSNARDTDGTVNSVQYFANATSIGTSTNAGTNYQINWTPNQSGVFNVWAIATDNTGITSIAPTVQVTVRRNNPVLEDAAFILQTYQDIANTTSINPLVFADLDAQLSAGTLSRTDLVMSLINEPGFVPPVNLLATYYVLMGHWPTPQNYTSLLSTARGSLANAVGSILSSNEYFAKYGVVPTATLLNNPASAIPASAFLARLHQNAGLPAPSVLQDTQFRSNNVASATLGRGYNATTLNTAIAEFVTNTNSNNTALLAKARAAAIYYQLNRPPIGMATDAIAARVVELVQLGTTQAMVESALKDVLYTYRFVTITKHPTSLTVNARSGVIFSVEALGAPPLAYQWLLNGAPIPGATDALLSITNVDASRVGTYTAVVTSSVASATCDPATLTLTTAATRLANISTRGFTRDDSSVLIGGFIVTGNANQTRQMLVRVVGPRLGTAPFNVTGFLADPRLELYRGTVATPMVTNDNWGTQTGGAAAVNQLRQATDRAGAFPLNNNSADAAVLVTLPPGPYTVIAKGPNAAASGVVLIEVYDVTQGGAAASKAENVSTRGFVGTGNNAMIAGFVVNGAAARRVLIRGVGPTLQSFGLAANTLLADPQIALVDQATGETIRRNDDWASGPDAGIIAAAARSAGAFPLANGSRDAGMLVMLEPGAYTVLLTGANNGTGIGIVEVYDVDP